jgi:hypothetical protein
MTQLPLGAVNHISRSQWNSGLARMIIDPRHSVVIQVSPSQRFLKIHSDGELAESRLRVTLSSNRSVVHVSRISHESGVDDSFIKARNNALRKGFALR